MKKTVIFAAVLGLPLGPLLAQTVPLYINYQGTVTAGNGTPLGSTGTSPNFQPSPVNRKIIFRIYGSQNGNDRLWSEQQTVTVSLGQFSVLLGQGTDAVYNSGTESRPAIDTVFTSGGTITPAGPDRYLEIVVDDGNGTFTTADLPIMPRQRITTTAYSFRARVADTVPDNAISANALAAGSVTGAKMATGSVNNTVIADDAVTGTKILNNAINSAKIADGSISTADLANSSVTAAKLGADVGLWSVNGGNLFRSSGNVGIGTSAPLYPLTFNNTTGDKISLGWGDVYNGNNFGFGVSENGHLQIHTPIAQNHILFGWGRSTEFNEVARIQNNGNMGIGTASPAARLHLHNTAGTERIRLSGTSFNQPLGGAPTDGVSMLLGYNSPGNRQLWIGDSAAMAANTTNTVLRVLVGSANGAGIDAVATDGLVFKNLNFVPGGGNVGIGPGAPTDAKLVINGGVDRTGLVGAFLGPAGTGGSSTNHALHSISLKTSGSIWLGHTIISTSDERVKNVMGHSDAKADLKTLQAIDITDYTYRDTIGKGSLLQKKVIAQQVEKVFPQAVGKHTDVVPDIYQRATVKDGWVQLATTLRAGERIKLIGKEDEGIHQVMEVAEGRFRTDAMPSGDEVFVYGREVNDFRTVDYEAISMLNVSATQEIKRELDAEVKSLREENAALQARITALEAKDKSRDARIAAIEAALDSSPKPALHTASLPAADTVGAGAR